MGLPNLHSGTDCKIVAADSKDVTGSCRYQDSGRLAATRPLRRPAVPAVMVAVLSESARAGSVVGVSYPCRQLSQ